MSATSQMSICLEVVCRHGDFVAAQTYTASLNLKVKPSTESTEQELKASSTASTKKAAAQICALQLLSQLYKLTLVEANTGTGPGTNKKQSKVKPPVRTRTRVIAFHPMHLNVIYAYSFLG